MFGSDNRSEFELAQVLLSGFRTRVRTWLDNVGARLTTCPCYFSYQHGSALLTGPFFLAAFLLSR